MPNEILMPQLPSREEGRLARWHVSEGQLVAPGDVIAEIETDTATLEIEAAGEGRIGRILVPAGRAVVRAATPLATVLRVEQPAERLSRPAPAAERAVSEPAEDAGRIGADGTASGPSRPHAGMAKSMEPPRGHGWQVAPASGGSLRQTTYREALRDALAEEMRRDPSVIVIGVGVAQNAGAPEVTQGLVDEFGAGRVIEVAPLVESYTGLAVGAAMGGLKPVVVYPSWVKAVPAFRQIMTSVAGALRASGGRFELPIVFRAPLVGEQVEEGAAAPGVTAWLAAIDQVKMVAPVTPAIAKGVLKAAVRDPGPVAIIEYQDLYESRGEVADDADALVALGSARIVQPGDGPTIVAMGSAVAPSEAAAAALAARGVAAEVIDLMSLSPIDWEAIVRSVTRTGRVVVAAGTELEGAIGAKVVAGVATRTFDALAAAPRQAPPTETDIVAAVMSCLADAAGRIRS